jgi:hypothetical protein
MRLRFTIRDLRWLTVVAALATGWWLDHRTLVREQVDEIAKIRTYYRSMGYSKVMLKPRKH